MLKKWDRILENRETDDQVIFQKIVFEMSANGKVLPASHFPPGRHYFEDMCSLERQKVVIIHNNFIVGLQSKIQRFKEWNLWKPLLQENGNSTTIVS